MADDTTSDPSTHAVRTPGQAEALQSQLDAAAHQVAQRIAQALVGAQDRLRAAREAHQQGLLEVAAAEQALAAFDPPVDIPVEPALVGSPSADHPTPRAPRRPPISTIAEENAP
jgi:hypothetical protein